MPSSTPALDQVGITPVTPFSRDLTAVDVAGLRANVAHLIGSGTGLLYPAGNTGEVMSLSPGEWTTVVETSVDVAAGRASIIPGIAHEFPVALELARRATSIGVDGLLLMPRSQPYASSVGLAEYWRRIADEAGLPVVIYKRGLPDDATVLEIVRLDTVVGCKYADKDVSRFAATAAGNPSVQWTCGSAERYAPFFWAAGARGFTSGLGNFAPRLALGLHRALIDGDDARIGELWQSCVRFEELRSRQDDAFNVAAVKVALDAVGLAGGSVRPPLGGLDEQEASEAAEMAVELSRRG